MIPIVSPSTLLSHSILKVSICHFAIRSPVTYKDKVYSRQACMTNHGTQGTEFSRPTTVLNKQSATQIQNCLPLFKHKSIASLVFFEEQTLFAST